MTINNTLFQNKLEIEAFRETQKNYVIALQDLKEAIRETQKNSEIALQDLKDSINNIKLENGCIKKTMVLKEYNELIKSKRAQIEWKEFFTSIGSLIMLQFKITLIFLTVAWAKNEGEKHLFFALKKINLIK